MPQYIHYHRAKRSSPTCPEGSLREAVIDSLLDTYTEDNIAIFSALSHGRIQKLDSLDGNDKK